MHVVAHKQNLSMVCMAGTVLFCSVLFEEVLYAGEFKVQVRSAYQLGPGRCGTRKQHINLDLTGASSDYCPRGFVLTGKCGFVLTGK